MLDIGTATEVFAFYLYNRTDVGSALSINELEIYVGDESGGYPADFSTMIYSGNPGNCAGSSWSPQEPRNAEFSSAVTKRYYLFKVKSNFFGTLDGSTTNRQFVDFGNIETVMSQAPAPVIGLAGGSYTRARSVGITCSLADAVIHYTTDGTTPDESSPEYDGEIIVARSLTLKARAWKNGYAGSTTTLCTYAITLAGDVEVSAGDLYPVSPDVFNQFYLEDGVTRRIVRILNGDTTNKDYATFILDMGITKKTFGLVLYNRTDVASGLNIDEMEIYTGDETDGCPCAFDTLVYSGNPGEADGTWAPEDPRKALFSTSTTSRYYLVKINANFLGTLDGSVTDRTFADFGDLVIIDDDALTPSISMSSGTYSAIIGAWLSCASDFPGVTYRYTTDGTTPTAASAEASRLVTVSSSMTLKVKACLLGEVSSATASATYSINSYSAVAVGAGSLYRVYPDAFNQYYLQDGVTRRIVRILNGATAVKDEACFILDLGTARDLCTFYLYNRTDVCSALNVGEVDIYVGDESNGCPTSFETLVFSGYPGKMETSTFDVSWPRTTGFDNFSEHRYFLFRVKSNYLGTLDGSVTDRGFADFGNITVPTLETLPDITSVTIDSNKCLRVNGSLFLPRRLSTTKGYGYVKAQGFNAVNCWGPVSALTEQLDLCYANNLYGTVVFNDSSFWSDTTGYDQTDLASAVNTLKSHPALLHWVLYDEPDAHSAWPVSFMTAGYNTISGADSAHPVMLNLCLPARFAEYDEPCDILSFDTYPIPTRAVTAISDYTDALGTACNWSKPLSVYQQCWTPVDRRMPTNDELRCMTYLAINHGAVSLAAYTYQFPYVTYPEGASYCLDNNGEMWSFCVLLNKELQSLTAAIASPAISGIMTCSNANIDYSVRQVSGDYYLIAANTSGSTCTPTITLNSGVTATEADVISESETIDIANNEFDDVFGPYEVHIYYLDE